LLLSVSSSFTTDFFSLKRELGAAFSVVKLNPVNKRKKKIKSQEHKLIFLF
jgi:hypothetical protein